MDDALSDSALQSELELMCRQLLSNPVIEDYSITVGGAPVSSGASVPTPLGLDGRTVSPLAATTDASTTAGSVATTDVVPNPQPLRPTAMAPQTEPAQFSAPRVSAPQTVVAPPATGEGVSILSGTTAAAMPAAATATPTSLPDPFAISYTAYDTMSADEKLALQGRAWELHSVWIMNELNTRRAAWILCLGQEVMESGDTIDTYPTDTRLETLGTANDLVPWVFTRPPQ
jgi:hypothetical protein